MTTAKKTHTPGPWTNERTKATTAALGKAFGAAIEEGDIEIWAGASCVALARYPRDARLLAAAPELLEDDKAVREVLGRVLDKCRDFLKKKDYELFREAMNHFEQPFAIDKAEGR